MFVNNLTRSLYQQLLAQFQANYLADLPEGTPVEIHLPFWAYLDPENMHYLDPQAKLSEQEIQHLAASSWLPFPNQNDATATTNEEEPSSSLICWQAVEGEDS